MSDAGGPAGAATAAAPVPLPDGVADLIPDYLGRQRWYSGEAPDRTAVEVDEADELAVTGDGRHRLLWAVVCIGQRGDAAGSDAEADGRIRYQLVIGERPNGELADFLHGRGTAILGSVGDCYYYDAVVDPELTLALLQVITDGAESADRVRPITAEQSNTSVVYDDHLICKIFRRLPEGENPDVVATEALARVGFNHVAAPVAVWRRHGYDLAFVQQFLTGGSEGWALALTSLRDLYSARPVDPAEAGGDFAAEARRLGQMTAGMHIALGEAFGVDREVFKSMVWPAVLASIEQRVRAVVGASWPGRAAEVVESLRSVVDPGPAIRVHGDYHLGQVIRTDTGWYVLDFEGEPARPIRERQAPSSPFKDVTGMLRSFQYAAHFALLEREVHEKQELARLAEAWEDRNREAFLDGYFGTPGIDALLPEGSDARATVSLAFELDKALYELEYERAYRPDWVSIPGSAIQRLLAGSFGGPDG
jgi:maltokinase